MFIALCSISLAIVVYSWLFCVKSEAEDDKEFEEIEITRNTFTYAPVIAFDWLMILFFYIYSKGIFI